MDHAEKLTFIAGLPSILVGCLTYLAGRKKADSEHDAAREAVAADEERTALEGWQALAEEYRNDRQRTQDELNDLRRDFEGLRQKVTELEHKDQENRAKVAELEHKDQENRARRRLALDYIRTLIGAMRVAGMEVPVPPGGLVIEDPANL